MKFPIYQVDAFCDTLFAGNPAAVVPLQAWLPEKQMQQIAAENNLSETAFFVQSGQGKYALRWFTPTVEVELCGNATLASAHVLFNHLGFEAEVIRFESKSGELRVSRSNGRIVLDFPAREPKPVSDSSIAGVLGKKPLELYKDLNYMAVFNAAEEVENFQPDFGKLATVTDGGIIITAPGNGKPYDFVSRYFAAYAGIDEDPVTGSAHCTLAPYWAHRLNKKELIARQASARGGSLYCRLLGERVEIAGHAVTYMEGHIYLPVEEKS